MDDCQQSDLNESLQPLFKWLFEQPNPIAINTALAMTKAIKPVFRLPYCPLDAEARTTGLKVLQALDKQFIVGKSLQPLDDEELLVVV